MSKLYLIPRKKRSKTVKKSEVDGHVDKICLRIRSNDPTFTDVNLQGLGLNKRHAKQIAEAIARNDHVKKLDLSHNKLRDDGAACIAKALKVNRSIHTLDLTFNELSISGVILFASPLKSNLCVSNLFFSEQAKAGPVPLMWCCPLIAMQQLRLQHHLKANQEYNKCMLGGALDVNLTGRLLVALPPEVCQMIHLKVLNASRNHLAFLPNEIGNLLSLEELDVSHNEITQLPPTLLGLQSLVTLNVSRNRIQSIPMAVAALPNLKTLDARDNHICSLYDLPARLLLFSPKLESVALSGNPILDGSVTRKAFQTSDTSAFMAFMRSHLDDLHPRARSAVLFVGPSNAGKTSCISWLKRVKVPYTADSYTASVRLCDNRIELEDNEGTIMSVNSGSQDSSSSFAELTEPVLDDEEEAEEELSEESDSDRSSSPPPFPLHAGDSSATSSASEPVSVGSSEESASPSRSFQLLRSASSERVEVPPEMEKQANDPKILAELAKCEISEADLQKMDARELERQRRRLERRRVRVETPMDTYGVVWRLENRYQKLAEFSLSHLELTMCDFKTSSAGVGALQTVRFSVSPHAVFCIVFDMSKACPKIAREQAVEELMQLQLWMRTAFSYVEHPTVLLVGTHSEQLDEADLLSLRLRLSQLMNKHAPHAFHFATDRLYDSMASDGDAERWVHAFVAVNSLAGKGMKLLRHSLLSEICNNLWIGCDLKDAFLLVGEKMRLLRHSHYVISKQEFLALDFTGCVVSPNAPHPQGMADFNPKEVARILELLHELNVVVYSEATPLLSEWIFLNPRWLGDLYGRMLELGGKLKLDPRFAATLHIWPQSRVLESWSSEFEYPREAEAAILALFVERELLFPLGTGRVNHVYEGSEAAEEAAGEREPLYLVPYFLPPTPPAAIKDGMWANAAAPRRVWGRAFDFSLLPVEAVHRVIAELHVRILGGDELSLVHEWSGGAFVYNREGEEAWFFENAMRHSIYLQVLSATGALLLKLIELINGVISEHYSRLSDCAVIGGDSVAPVRDCLIQCPHCMERDLPVVDCTFFLLSECLESAAVGNMYHYCDNINLECGRVPVRIDSMSPDVTLSKLEHLKISIDRLLLDKVVGQGSFGKVFRARLDGQVVAAKFMAGEGEGDGISSMSSSLLSSRRSTVTSDRRDTTAASKLHEKYAEFRKEVESMAGLDHPNIVSLRALCLAPLCVVTDFCARGDLQRYLADHQHRPLNLSFILRVAADMALGMRFLHNATPRLTHCDFKSPNVLLARWQWDEEESMRSDEDSHVVAGKKAWAKLCDLKTRRLQDRTSPVSRRTNARCQTFSYAEGVPDLSLPASLPCIERGPLTSRSPLSASSPVRQRNPLLRADSGVALTSRQSTLSESPQACPPVVRVRFPHLKSAKTFPLTPTTTAGHVMLLVLEKITREREVVTEESFSKTYVQFAEFCLAFKKDEAFRACKPAKYCFGYVMQGARELVFMDRKETENPDDAAASAFYAEGVSDGDEQDAAPSSADTSDGTGSAKGSPEAGNGSTNGVAEGPGQTEAPEGPKTGDGADVPSFVLDTMPEEFFDPSRVIAKIADFGLSTRSTLPQSKRFVANPLWLAPEILKGESYSIEADVYGYGIVLWELFARRLPFHSCGITFMSLLEEAIIGGLRPPIPSDVPPRIAALISKCWANDPSERPNFGTIVDEITEIALELLPNSSTPNKMSTAFARGSRRWRGEELRIDDDSDEEVDDSDGAHLFKL